MSRQHLLRLGMVSQHYTSVDKHDSPVVGTEVLKMVRSRIFADIDEGVSVSLTTG